eukprot:403372989
MASTEEALTHFQVIKDLYQQKIEDLSSLKRLIFAQTEKELDQQLRSKLRITIESLLIDLNEEVFAISEELAKSFTFERNKNTLMQRAQEFEQRQRQIIKKIKDSIDKNPTIKNLRRSQRITNITNSSPPQRDLNTFGANGFQDQEQFNNKPNQHQQKPLPHPKNIHTNRNPSPQVKSNKIKLYQSNSAQKLIQDNGQMRQSHERVSFNSNMNSSNFNGEQMYRTEQQQYGNIPQSTTSLHANQRQGSFKNLPSSSKNQNVKRSLKKKKSPIPLRRKDQNQDDQQTIQLLRTSLSAKRNNSLGGNSNYSAKKQLQFRNTDVELRRMFGTSDAQNRHINPNRTQDYGKMQSSGQKQIRRLDEFEKFLGQRNGTEASGRKRSISDKENIRLSRDFNGTRIEAQNLSTIELQSEAFQVFSQDFAHMKQKIIQMQRQLNQTDEKAYLFEDQLNRLKTENIKLTTDMKIIKSEHVELLEKVDILDKKNHHLQQENQILRNMIKGEKQIKGQESNLPRPAGTNHSRDNSMISQKINEQSNSQTRRQSPFSSFLNRNRSISSLQGQQENPNIVQQNNQFSQPSENTTALRGQFSFFPTLNQTQGHNTLTQTFERDETQEKSHSKTRLHANLYTNPLLSGDDAQNIRQSYQNLPYPNTVTNTNTQIKLNPQFQMSSSTSKIPSGYQSLRGEKQSPFTQKNHSGINNRLNQTTQEVIPITPERSYYQSQMTSNLNQTYQGNINLSYQDETPSQFRERERNRINEVGQGHQLNMTYNSQTHDRQNSMENNNYAKIGVDPNQNRTFQLGQSSSFNKLLNISRQKQPNFADKGEQLSSWVLDRMKNK